MRILAAVAVVGACLLGAVSVEHGHSATFAQLARGATHALPFAIKQRDGGKPGGPVSGDDSCRWAHDNECDDPDIGTGACRQGTDFSDCRHLRQGEDDSCRWARDGECDEPNFGTGACTQGTDRTDCGSISWMRNQTDACATSFNGICEEPGHGNGSCAARTDRTDCHGRDRPLSIHDHFFGHDDRVRVNVQDTPWRFIGRFTNSAGESCTATLIARNVIITAAHCINGDNGVTAGGVFVASNGATAHTVAYALNPRYDYHRFISGNDIDGMDWALLRIDNPLGERLGFAGVRSITGSGLQSAHAANLLQAGFAWDTGDTMAANVNCHIVRLYNDDTFAHECDTTRGDSGSSFLVRDGDGYSVIGVDSNFRSNPDGPFLYIAVSASGFARFVPDFVAGRTGAPVGGSNKPK
jgi:protease YdgD